MIVLSLFDGISGARTALDKLNIPIKYYASEVDKNAINISRYHYPDIIQLGDVTKITRDMIDGEVDLICGGSPCQSMSAMAGQEESGLEKGASTLFWEYLRVLKLFKPKYFLLENVASMKPADKEKITKVVNEIYPDSYCIKINSSILTAQSRNRLYWTNIPDVKMPENKGILLKDIIDFSVTDGKSYYYTKEGNKIELTQTYVGNTLSFKDTLLNLGITELYTYDYAENNNEFDKEKYPREGETRPKNGYKIDVTEKINKTRANKYRLEHIRGVSQKSRCLGTGCMSIANTSGTGLFVKGVYRSLTILECERLQGLPDQHTKISKDENGSEYKTPRTHRAKAIGNGFTIPVVAHILSFIPKDIYDL